MGTIHLVFSLIAMVLGGTTLSLSKGTRWHRTWGHGYVWAMAGVVGREVA